MRQACLAVVVLRSDAEYYAPYHVVLFLQPSDVADNVREHAWVRAINHRFLTAPGRLSVDEVDPGMGVR